MGEVDAGRAYSSALAAKDHDLRGIYLYGEGKSIGEGNPHPLCCALLASISPALQFNITYIEAPKGVVCVVMSRCLYQASTKEDIKIIEDAVI